MVQFVASWIFRVVTKCLQPSTFHVQLVDAHLRGGRSDARGSNMANSAFSFLLFSFLFHVFMFLSLHFSVYFFVLLTHSGGGKWGVENLSLLDPKHQRAPFCLHGAQVSIYIYKCRSQWPHGLRRRSAAARLLRSWVRIPPGAWMFVCCECCQVEVSATS